MKKDIFDVNKFNIIEDEENYYFFRALNMSDNNDIENDITTSQNGAIEKIRTDRERYEENLQKDAPKYNSESQISLEEVYDHIKMHYRKDTNCISLSSNANVSVMYGRGYYKDKYVMIKVPKKEMGEKFVNAGQYMLQEIEKRVNEYISSADIDKKVLDILEDIEKAKTVDELKTAIKRRYKSLEILNPDKAGPRKGIIYKNQVARISKYQSLNEEQSLEKNRIIAKLTILERLGNMPSIIPNTKTNSSLIETVGNAYSSLEIVHYGDIEKENIIELPKEMVDIFALLQQVEGQDEKLVKDLKQEIINYIAKGKSVILPKNSSLLREDKLKENITIEQMYELTEGKVEYEKANSIINKMFYLSKSQKNARALGDVLKQIVGNNSKYSEIIKYISENGFRIEPQIITRRNNKGVKISESTNLDLKGEEVSLIDKIKKLTDKEQLQILKNGGLSDVKDVMSSTFFRAKSKKIINKEKYYAEAIFSLYDWKKVGLKGFTSKERNNIIKRIQDEHCLELYQKLVEQDIPQNKIPTILLNLITRSRNFEIKEEDTK